WSAPWESPSLLCRQAAAFDTIVRPCRLDVIEFLDPSTRPRDDHPLQAIAPADTECDGQLRLRKIAGPGLDHSSLKCAAVKEANRCSDRVAVGLRACQTESNRPVPGQ